MDARPFIKRNASTILTVLGSIGVVATTITSVKATPKALRLIEDAKQEKGEELKNGRWSKQQACRIFQRLGLQLQQ